MSEKGLVAESLACRRSGRLLFEGLSLQAGPGRMLEICGRNGSGKTTLIRLLCGLRQPDEGSILWQGADIHRNVDHYRQSLCYVGHLNGLKADLSPVENLIADARLHGSDPAQVAPALQEMGLSTVMDLPCRQLSAGQRQRAALARLRIRRSSLWILDEPCASVDRQAQQQIQDMLETHAAGGGTVVFTTHQPLSFREIHVEQLWLGEGG